MTPSALLYVRVSSKDQEKEGWSLDAQEKLGYEYAKRKGFNIVKMWKVSESAWRKERVAFNQMVEYAKNHDEIKHIIFDVLDRMTRNDFDKLKIVTLVKEYGKNIHFSRSNKIFNRESSTDDEFMFDIEVAVAKKQSNDISRKTQMGMVEKAEQGFFPATAPLGYKNNREKKLLELNPDQAASIKKAFELMSTGKYSLDMIREIPEVKGLKTNRSNKVNKSTLSYVLNNPFYYGLFQWKGKIYQGNHEPLISKELFDRTQQVLNGKFHTRKSKKGFAFNNLLVCGECSCKVLGEEKRKPNNLHYVYYHCTFSKGRHNGKGYIPETRLAQLFEKPVMDVVLPAEMSDWIKEGLGHDRKNLSETHENRLKSLQSQHSKVNDRLNRLYDDRFDGKVDDEVFKTKETEYKALLLEIKGEIEKAKKVNPNFYEDGLATLELPNLYISQYDKASYPNKAVILKKLASNYTLNDVTITAAYRQPFIFLAKMKGCPNWLPRLDSNQNTEIQSLMSYQLDDRASKTKNRH